MKASCLLLVLLGCTPSAQQVEPALFSPQLASDRSLVIGTVISKELDAQANPHVVIVDNAGRPFHVQVLRLSRAGMTLETGDTVTAWCRGAGENLVADSVRVDKHRVARKSQEVPPYVPAPPP